MYLRSYDYEVFHISGEDNIWADLLTRWGAEEQLDSLNFAARRSNQNDKCNGLMAETEAAAMVRLRVRQDRILLDDQHDNSRTQDQGAPTSAEGDMGTNEEWPDLREIIEVQQTVSEEIADAQNLKRVGELWYDQGERLYIPEDNISIQSRLMVIAHAGAGGHRGQATTIEQLERVFVWPGMRNQIKQFLSACLLCCKTRGGGMTPPPLGEAVNGNEPGESVHIDYISIRDKEGILVMKCGFSCWTMLFYAEDFDGPTTERALIHWASIFGVPKIIVSDGGSHFNNNLVKALVRRFRA